MSFCSYSLPPVFGRIFFFEQPTIIWANPQNQYWVLKLSYAQFALLMATPIAVFSDCYLNPVVNVTEVWWYFWQLSSK